MKLVARLAAALASLGLALSLTPEPVQAHGRPPFIGAISVDPRSPERVVARGTFGLVTTDDGGETWRWSCAAAMGFDPTREDPAITVVGDGAILSGSFDGLSRSDPAGCEWAYPDEAVTDAFIIDVVTEPGRPEVVLAVRTTGVEDDQLLRSEDGGRSFRALGPPLEDVLLERVRVAPSDPSRVYMSGAIPGIGGVERRAFLYRSDDGGESFETLEVALEEGERNLHLFAVDPDDGDRILVRALRRVTDETEERLLLSEDGGRTLRSVLEARELRAALFAGDRVYAGARTGGLFVSDDRGETFTSLIEDASVLCLERVGDEVWACLNELRDDVSIARITGDEFESVFRFQDIGGLLECPACSPVGFICPAWMSDLAYDLRLVSMDRPDGGPPLPGPIPAPPECDGGVPLDGGASEESTGCGCHIASRPARLPWPALAVVLLAARRRRPGTGRVDAASPGYLS